MESIHRKRAFDAKGEESCRTKEALREIFKRAVLLLEKARKTAPFPVMQEIDEFKRHIDTVVEPNMLIGGCDKTLSNAISGKDGKA